MKNFILLGLFLSIPALAGDQYLVCESADGDFFESASFEGSFADLGFDVVDGDDTIVYSVFVNASEQSNAYSITKYDAWGEVLGNRKLETKEGSEPVAVTDAISCRISD